MTKQELFLELSKPNSKGVSRWVKTKEFTGKYSELELLNGLSWGRKSSTLAKKYKIETNKNLTNGNKIDEIRLNGFNLTKSSKLSQSIRMDIKKEISNNPCVILGTKISGDLKPEVDHKDGRKDNELIMNTKTQKIEDFQSMSKSANDAKREFCKKCKETNQRYDAKKLGYNVSVTIGDLSYDNINKCNGCYWFDPIEFRKKLFLK